MAVDVPAIARDLYENIMAPLVVGGAVRPGHAIGARVALALGGQSWPLEADLETRVQRARVRRARVLAPIDTLSPATPGDWALAAAFHDILQAANPTFDAPLRRGAAERILALARQTTDRVAPPSTVREALARHTWFARVLDVARTDTVVSWWLGSQAYLGVEPPRRLQAWPELRRVRVVATPHRLLELEPLAVDRTALTDAAARLLARTPLTEFAACTRSAPQFSWGEAALALVATRPGRTLALRALGRLPAKEVDAALGRATRDLLTTRRAAAAPAVTLLAEWTLAQADGLVASPWAASEPVAAEVAFARGLGAAAALVLLDSAGAPWRDDERQRLRGVVDAAAQSPAAREATAMLGERA